MRQSHSLQQRYCLAIIFIFIILMGTVPIHLTLSPFTEEPVPDKHTEIAFPEGAENSIKVPRLMETHNISSNTSFYSFPDMNSSSQKNQTTLSFAIGSQTGSGGGNYEVNDSLKLTNLEQLNLGDTHSNPDVHDDQFTITIPGGFTNNSGSFNISNITPLYDWRHVENDRVGGYTIDSTNGTYDAIEAAMEFSITEEYANLSSIRVISEYETYENITDIYDPTGKIFIVNSTWVTVPYGHWKPNPDDILSSQEDVLLLTSWRRYTFDSDVILRGDRSYYLVFNDTSNTPAYWRWGAQKDSGANGDNNDEGEFYYKYQTHSSSWLRGSASTALDLNLRIEVKPVQFNGTHFVDKKFTQPEEIALLYDSSIDDTSLSRFKWFEWNGTADNIHRFSTNTSVSFDLSWNVNLTNLNNPLTAFSSYLAVNNTITHWNLTFSTPSITTSYNIRNRTITVNGLEDDWNGTTIYHDNSLIYNIPNPSVTYSNRSPIMIVNSSDLSGTKEWDISFDAPNYITSFTWLNSSIPVTKAYATDTLIPEITNRSDAIGGYNLTVSVNNSLGTLIYYNTGRNITDILPAWDINKSTSLYPPANGVYSTEAFWLNTTTNQVGFYTRNITVYINTNLTLLAPTEVVIDTSLDITVHYNCTHNFTAIDNANVTGVPSWDPGNPVQFTQSISHGSYTFSFSITKPPHNPGDLISVTIYAGLPWFLNRSKISWDIKIVDDATLVANTTDKLEWRENTTLRIEYNASSDGKGISDANVSVDGDWDNVYNISNVYYYKFNSTKYGGSGSYPNLNITANHSNYLTRVWYFDLVINLGSTNITGSVGLTPVTNKTPIITQIFADSAADSLILKLQYYYNATGDPLNTDTPDIESLIPVTGTDEDTDDFHWNITLNPDKVGVFLINLTFALTNYENCTFIFNLTIQNAGTAVESTLAADQPVYYTESYDLFLLYNNTNYNENITGLTDISGITINNSKVVWRNETNEGYWFRFSPSPLSLGSHAINISFSLNYFNISWIVVTFQVLARPTSIEGRDALDNTFLPNETYIYYRNYSPGNYDNFSIRLGYYDVLTGLILNVESDNVTIDPIASIIYLPPAEDGNNNWTLIFEGSLLGTFLINITFVHANHLSATFTVRYVIQSADSTIINYSPNISDSPINATVKSNEPIDLWVVWKSEYNEFLNDSDGVFSNDSSIVLSSSNPSNGTHYFRFNASTVKNYTISLIFETVNYTAIEIILRFQVINRSLEINDILSTHENDWISPVGYLQYGDVYYFHIIINDSETKDSIDITSFTGLDIINVTSESVSSGDHLFTYQAWTIATTNPVELNIKFKLTNYVEVTYNIRFYVKVAKSAVLDVPLSLETNYTEDMYIFGIWQSEINLNAPLTPIRKINSTRITSSLPVLFQGYDNGNYTFLIRANQTGTFVLTLDFFSSTFENQSVQVTITILPVPTVFSSVSLINNSYIGQTPPFYYSELYNISFTWVEEINNSGIRDISPAYSGNGSTLVSLRESFINGTHIFSIDANTLGVYQVIITLNIDNYVEQRYFVFIIVNNIPTFLHLSSTPNNTIIGETPLFNFSEVHSISVVWVENLTLAGLECATPSYYGNGTDFISLYPVIIDGVHQFSIHGKALGIYQVTIVLSISYYVDLMYTITFIASIMETLPLDISSFTYNESILVENIFSITGNGSYQTFRSVSVPNNFTIEIWLNDTSVAFDDERENNWFNISFATEGFHYGNYNLTMQFSLDGYQIQPLSLNITLQGREIILTVTLPSKTFEQGEPFEITALLNYTQTTDGGSGAGILLTPLSGIEVSFYIGLKYSNGTTRDLPVHTTQTDVLGQATYSIDGEFTQDATGFSKIDVESGPSLSGLPSIYSMSAAELAEYEIIYIFDPLEIIIPVIIIGVVILLIVGTVAASGITLNRKRKRRSATIHKKRRKVEQSFEDIKSIRLLIARHESGLQFYSEKTIAELQTDTDALSGMSAALSSFMEEVSDGMRSRPDEQKEKDKIEVMSREGLHMLIWNGKYSSFIIISEVRLPDYFQNRLSKLGREVEAKFADDLQDFFRSDQIPSSQVKKMVRKHIPLHYFSAFILNEGVVTLESIKLSGKEKKMLNLIKEIRFQKEGVQFFFSEQIISHLSKHFNRSETIKFLDRAIEINLLIEASQEDILNISK